MDHTAEFHASFLAALDKQEIDDMKTIVAEFIPTIQTQGVLDDILMYPIRMLNLEALRTKSTVRYDLACDAIFADEEVRRFYKEELRRKMAVQMRNAEGIARYASLTFTTLPPREMRIFLTHKLDHYIRTNQYELVEETLRQLET